VDKFLYNLIDNDGEPMTKYAHLFYSASSPGVVNPYAWVGSNGGLVDIRRGLGLYGNPIIVYRYDVNAYTENNTSSDQDRRRRTTISMDEYLKVIELEEKCKNRDRIIDEIFDKMLPIN
jgi:hypothetical protein